MGSSLESLGKEGTRAFLGPRNTKGTGQCAVPQNRRRASMFGYEVYIERSGLIGAVFSWQQYHRKKREVPNIHMTMWRDRRSEEEMKHNQIVL